jgi:hypothetical protein
MQAPIIRSSESFRRVIAKDFDKDLPIRGGWGYTRDDAIIIDKYDANLPKGIPTRSPIIERFIIEKRIYEELIIFRKKGDQFNDIKWELLQQRVVQEIEKTFDHLRFRVTGLHDRDWQELKTKWEGPDGYISPHFNRVAHLTEHKRRAVCYETDYWFDISSFF